MIPDLAIVGPTATGKTELAARLRDVVEQADLLSIDALAVYRGMDIGTAKPSRPADPASRHPWALVDLADPDEDFSVARFQTEARAVRRRSEASGHPCILVGGTGLYHRAVVDDLELPARYPGVAARLESEADSAGVPALHDRLRELDPVAAGRMEPRNRRRVIRALEVVEGSGRRFSEFGPGLEAYPASEVVMVGLAIERPLLDARLADRLRRQMAEGFLAEVGALAGLPGGVSRTARQAIGYAELFDHLAGRTALEAATDEIVRRLKSFARRQQSWFGRDPRIRWFDATSPTLTGDVLDWWKTRWQ